MLAIAGQTAVPCSATKEGGRTEFCPPFSPPATH